MKKSYLCGISGLLTLRCVCAKCRLCIAFCEEPDRVIPGCKIRFLRFDGEQEGTGKSSMRLRISGLKD